MTDQTIAEGPPKADPFHEQLAQFERNFMARADEKTREAREYLNAHPDLTGPCPCDGCSTLQPVDEVATLEESQRRGEVTLVFQACDDCVERARKRERLLRWGFPGVVVDASFANYEVYDERQKKVVETAQQFTCNDTLFLFLLGGCGTGKGHLASAIAQSGGKQTKWITHQDLIEEYHSRSFEDRKPWLERVARYPLLVLDEMGGKNMTSDTPEIFYKLLNDRYSAGRKTILLGNIPLRSRKPDGACILKLIGDERADSRIIGHGAIATLPWEDYRKRSRKGGAK